MAATPAYPWTGPGLRRGGGVMARETRPGGVRPRHEEQFPI